MDAARSWSWDRSLLLVLSACAGGILLATPQLITPYPDQAPWFESAALFPRLALGLAAVAGLVEVFMRRHAVQVGDSEELDSSAANLRQAVACLCLFGLYMLAVPLLGYLSSTVLFLLACGGVLQLGWRTTLRLTLPLSLIMWLVFVKVLKVYFGHGWWI
jgi:hypothetical protein